MQYDYYKILELPRTATLDDIKRAYRNKAKLFHPDVNASAKANEVFAIINEAYEVLSNERKRYLHDVKLNYVDATKASVERKKHYYGTSIKNDSPKNAFNTNFHYDWDSLNKSNFKEKTDEDYFKKSPFIYNLFFASGMFVGFLIITITLKCIYKHYWPLPFILICIPGFILVREGWKGMIGKRTMMSRFIKKFRK